MIDFSKLSGPAGGSSTPVGPTTPTPLAGAPPAPDINGGMAAPAETGAPSAAPTQAQIDAMAPWDRAGRGLDVLGQALFGQNNGSLLGGAPVIGEAGRALGVAGDLAHGAGTVALKPFEIAAGAAARVPLGWLPGGADENFNHIGDWMKTNDPQAYANWQTVNAAANADVLFGGNLKADFNTEAAEHYDQMTKDGTLGNNPMLSMGRAGVGSLGGAVSHTIQGFLGLGAQDVQQFLGDNGVFDPSGHGGQPGDIHAQIASKAAVGQVSDDAEYAIKQFQSGAFTEAQANDYLQKNVGAGRTRVDEAIARLDSGGDISEVEKTAAENVKSGLWSEQHASDYIVSHGQSITRNPVGQVILGALTDPLTYATAGAAAVSKAGAVGKAVQEAGLGAQTTYERLGAITASVQQSQLGPAFRLMRGMIDPLGVYVPKDSATRGLVDLRNGAALHSLQSAAGPQTISDVRAIARETEMGTEVDSAMGAFSMDQANLLMAREHVETELKHAGMGEELFTGAAGNPDEIIAPMVANASKDVIHRLTDSIAAHLHMVRPHEMENLAGRLASTLGKYDKATWLGRVEKMSDDARSTWHAITYKLTEKDLAGALAKVDAGAYQGKLPLDRLVLLTENNLDNVSAEALTESLGKGTIASRTASWNAAELRYGEIADIGHAPGGKKQLDALVAELKHQLDAGQFHQRALPEELADPALKPIRDVIDRHTIDGEPLWNVGFRPEETVAWGLKRDAATGAVKVGRDPTVSHVMDAVPGRSPFSDTVRNVLGQIIGPAKAEIGAKPIDSVETFMRTATDVVSGRRIVNNIERRFQKTLGDAGVPTPIVKDIFDAARDVAGLDHTTVRGIRPDNLWAAMHELVPSNLVLKDGTHLNVHVVMDHLLTAAEGDLRIIGLSSKMTQRMRNIARARGIDSTNWMGQWTVSMYNKLRYSQPTFLIQRITDAPYFGAMRGMMPMGKGALKDEALIATRRIEDNMRRTGTARDFAWTNPEYATRANFTEGIRSKMQQAGLDNNLQERIANTPDAVIRNNMTKQMHARLGQIVREVLDHDLPASIKNAPIAEQAEMLKEAETLGHTFAAIRNVYSHVAGRTLTDEEVGLRYIQEQIASARRVGVGENGIDVKALIHEMEWSKPNSIGEITSIRPEEIAQELGYSDAAALRRDIHGTYDRATGTIKPGDTDMPAVIEKLREGLHAHPDYIARFESYFGNTWEGYWSRLAKPVEAGGLDISKHYAREAQDVVAAWAKTRGMDPWEYLSQVMKTNLGSSELDQHLGRLMAFLQAGGKSAPIEEWTKFFRSNLDLSAQHTFLDEFEAATKGAAAPVTTGLHTFSPITDLEMGVQEVRDAANEYMASVGRSVPERRLFDVHPDFGRRTAEAYDALPSPVGKVKAGPPVTQASLDSAGTKLKSAKGISPEVRKAYQAFVDETKAQYDFIKSKGISIEPVMENPYANSAEMMADVAKNHRLKVFADSAEHPLMTDAQNVMFRGVHDYFAHAAEGFQFGPKGEVNAAIKHSQMYSEEAQRAMLTETHGQNSYVNFSQKAAADGKTVAETNKAKPGSIYAEQKAGLLPDHILQEFRQKYVPATGADVQAAYDAGDVAKGQALNKEVAAARGGTAESGGAIKGDDFDKAFQKAVISRVNSGVPHPNPEIEGYFQQFSKWVQASLQEKLTGSTRADLRRLVENVPTIHATPFNRTHALVEQLLKDKINQAQDDVFMLAEMGTRSNVLMRSLNHPLFGIYPSSYMWGKVLPQTVKFLAQNPYGATYTINNVQRAIALQREYDPEFDSKMDDVDKSSGSFLAGYLTPSLPWENMQAQTSPFVRDLLQGKDVGAIWADELKTTSPARWFNLMSRSYQEGVDLVQGAVKGQPNPTTLTPGAEQGLNGITQQPASGPAGQAAPDINGPVHATDLAPVLGDQLTQLQGLFR